MHSIKLIFAKYSAYVLGLLGHLGIWGPLVLAMLDSGAFGIPMDPVMIGYAWRDRHQLWLVVFYCLTASVGSAVGSLLPYAIGRAGGELLLLKRIDRQRLDKMRDRFESQEFIFMMIPAMLPPPTPFKLFVLCAGVFEMRVVLFALAIATGRLIRFAITSYLVIRFGPDIVRVIMNTAQHHLVAALATLILFVTVGLVWRKLHKRRRAARA